MTRRKSVCSKWTLVLLVVIVCPSVYSRPQDEVSASTTIKALNEKTTNAPIRYKNNNLSSNSFKLASKVISFVNTPSTDERNVNININNESNPSNIKLARNRTSRSIRANSEERKNKYKPKPLDRIEDETHDRKKPAIRKVLTKWRDKTKLNDLNFSYETSTLNPDVKGTTKIIGNSLKDDTSTENSSEMNAKRYTRPPNDMYDDPYYNDNNNMMYNNNPRPHYSYPDESQHVVYTPNIQVINTPRPRPTRPPHYHTNIPTPTPIITNLGYPKPWTQQVTRKTTTQRPFYNTRPTNYEYNNHVQNYGGNNYEVSTFEPTNSYTDRIVIRPEEYSPHAEDCPTIYLTLNNTFQGQAKEACPDLNIAVNTNVINKNVVIESEEESDSLFPGGFGLGLGDDSGTDSSKDEDYFESDENQEGNTESASIEGTELANYHSANSVIKPESAESNFGAASSPSSAIIAPGGGGDSDDDLFSFSSLVDFFRPALDALGWLATINPLSIGFFPLILAPLGLLFAGSGFAALFAPWFLPYAREAPKVIHVYKPEWRWDDDLKTWQLHSFPNNRRLVPDMSEARVNKGNEKTGDLKPTLFSRVKEWMKNVTNILRENHNRRIVSNARKTKRKKREAWTRRLKNT
ncbi:unnamed protein product [Spodoptera exigua]|uniref:Uncharacterized protein n=1 Tax=Spodoptera exigua TaxID=7107 RepID=A0A922MYT2_SPOEX|nr:hypothetical protein HF086_005701 [Spodoptera exigua]CAH0686074.1 unnamed protein product [Spodoptera exigua]